MVEKNELSINAKGGTELMLEKLHKYVDKELLDQVQVIPSRVRVLDPDKKNILWCHDLALDPEVAHLKDGGWKDYDKIVFVSYWQQQMYNIYLGVPYSAGVVLKNAIDPIEDDDDNPDLLPDTIKLIYTPTPHRGLELLYPVFVKLCEEHDNIELDVYSSFKLYGWESRDEPYKELFDALKEHDKINYHGTQSNDVVRKALQEAHIFAYPSIWQETSCLCLIEAMSAECHSVHSSLAGLPETSMGVTQMYGYTEDNSKHASIFYAHLKHAIKNYENLDSRIQVQNNLSILKPFIDVAYSWERRAKEWENMLRNLLRNL
jgi:glycosyltransferase involved in cell wall biosynthesis